jgi:hypothetical protein
VTLVVFDRNDRLARVIGNASLDRAPAVASLHDRRHAAPPFDETLDFNIDKNIATSYIVGRGIR